MKRQIFRVPGAPAASPHVVDAVAAATAAVMGCRSPGEETRSPKHRWSPKSWAQEDCCRCQLAGRNHTSDAAVGFAFASTVIVAVKAA